MSHEQRFENFSIAVQNRKGIAVLGVLFHVSDEINQMLKNILDSAENIKDDVGKSSEIKKQFSPLDLLPEDRLSYFRYEGSLTTPSCDEAVIWTVLDKSLPFAMTQIERFKQIKDPNGNQLTHNFRQVKPLNSRPLVYVRDDFANVRHSASGAHKLSVIILTIFIALQAIQCFREIF